MVAPGTAEVVLVGMVLNGAVVEHVEFRVSRDGRAATLLVHQLHLVVVNFTVTAEVVNGAVKFTTLPVVETAYLMRIIGVLMGEQNDILADGLGSLIVQRGGTSVVTSVSKVVLQCQILHIETFTSVVQKITFAQAFLGGTGDDDGLLGTLSDE